MNNVLPFFHEHENDPNIPEGYGIDESHDGGFYPYIIFEDQDGTGIHYIPDGRMLDKRFTSYSAALAYIQKRQAQA